VLSLNDPRWSQLSGGHRVPYDPRPLFARFASEKDGRPIWKELWEGLHHQGDVGEASYAAVPHLVRIHRERGVIDWNTYAIVACIELARDSRQNPPVPEWLIEGYNRAIQELADIGRQELASAANSETVRSILALLAIAKGVRIYGRIILNFEEDEVLELERQAFGRLE
jgi:hypothetical protein